MTTNHIHVTYDDIRDVASRLETEGAAIGVQLDSLLDQVLALVQSGWQGQAAFAFGGMYGMATQGWREVETALAQMASVMRSIVDQYGQFESSIASTLSA